MDSASLLSRESTTLSFANPQKGHFMALMWQKRLNQMYGVNKRNCNRGARPRRADGYLRNRQQETPLGLNPASCKSGTARLSALPDPAYLLQSMEERGFRSHVGGPLISHSSA